MHQGYAIYDGDLLLCKSNIIDCNILWQLSTISFSIFGELLQYGHELAFVNAWWKCSSHGEQSSWE